MTVIKYQADADLRHSILIGILRRNPNVDFQSAQAAGLQGKEDSSVLSLAAQEGRILVTHDRKTMPSEFGRFIVSNTSAGVFILSQKIATREAIEALLFVWEHSLAEEWVNQIITIPF